MVKDNQFKPTFKKELNVPKTYEQFILEEKNLDQQGLYPDLTHGDINIQKSYGPGSDTANETKWCSECKKSVTVSSSSTKYCPDCGTAFGTVAKKSKAQEQADKNTQVAAEKGGKSTYKSTTDKDGNVVETAEYTKQ